MVVPRATAHKPLAERGRQAMRVEPAGRAHTVDAGGDLAARGDA
jgi:hypothetical protein